MNNNKDLLDSNILKHIAIIMDGNGRWATQQNKPRVFGHRKGVETVREMIRCCSKYNIPYLTLFAFSSENWQRPKAEVNLLMQLFISTLEKEISEIHSNGIRLNVIGDISKFRPRLQKAIFKAQDITKNNTKLVLSIAANYGGRWDIVGAAKALAEKVKHGELDASQIDEFVFSKELCTHALPDPDLFIRTGGDYRVSNFLLWQLAYSELYFTQTHWPDFDEFEFKKALKVFLNRQRRFGLTGEQMEIR